MRLTNSDGSMLTSGCMVDRQRNLLKKLLNVCRRIGGKHVMIQCSHMHQPRCWTIHPAMPCWLLTSYMLLLTHICCCVLVLIQGQPRPGLCPHPGVDQSPGGVTPGTAAL